MTGRRLVPVRLDHSVLTGDQLPRPRVGEIAAYGLCFGAATEHSDPDDPTLSVFTVRIEPLNGGQPRRNRRYDGTPHQRWPRWSSLVHGDGWAAGSTSFRPPPSSAREDGVVVLRGGLGSEFGCQANGWIRGRINRLWTVQARRDIPVNPDDVSTWSPAWGSTELFEVDEMPMWTSGQQPPTLPAGVYRAGLLAELDLDAVPNGRTGGVVER